MNTPQATNSHVHPLFQAILNGIVAQPAILDRCAYETALRKFDWQFEFSDDGEVYRRGRDALQKLREQQQRIDPAGTIWLSIAPRSHGVPQPRVRGE